MNLQRRLMLAIGSYTLGVASLFALFAMAFTYTVEDRFIERGLQQEAARLKAGFAGTGQWPAPAVGMQLHLHSATLPTEVAAELAREPSRTEFAGNEGRHYHLLALQQTRQPPWLLSEVSGQLIVRPMRSELLHWLVGWGVLVLLLSLGLGVLLARHVSRPVVRLAAQAAQAQPDALPVQLAGTQRHDEIGELARRLTALLARTREFIEREQAFTRDASHELRTPLAVLRLGLERLVREANAPAPAVAPLLAAVQLMQQTVATLLQLAREPAATDSNVPAAVLPMVETWVLAHAQALDARGQTVACHLNRNDAIRLPAPVLQLALANLLANALAHGDAGGVISIDARPGQVRVHNPGLGQTSGDAAREGLGLMLVQRLLARHGGRLRFTQQGGSTQACIEVMPPS